MGGAAVFRGAQFNHHRMSKVEGDTDEAERDPQNDDENRARLDRPAPCCKRDSRACPACFPGDSNVIQRRYLHRRPPVRGWLLVPPGVAPVGAPPPLFRLEFGPPAPAVAELVLAPDPDAVL